tara:strand:- start:2480 stop:3088 length:609 start_codon:yes stop_codon:yes gene_type:complete
MNLLPQTELEAVNVCLQNINESPVSSLDTAFADALMARQMLHDNSRKIQSIGLVCNTDYELTIARDSSNHINLPANTLKVYIPRKTNEGKRDVVQRGQKLYDRKNNTYVFDEDLKVTLVSFLEWEDLPQVVRSYITINTARKFGAQVVGDTDLFQLTQQDELEARIEFRREQIDVEQANILYDSEASFGVLHRTRDYPNYGI